MKFVLILLMSAHGGSGLNSWQQPAITTATFDDRPACEAAADAVRKMERQANLRFMSVAAACLPTGSGSAATQPAAPG